MSICAFHRRLIGKGYRLPANKMNSDLARYHDELSAADRPICSRLYGMIHDALPDAENKVWHGHPVWFLDGNPIVGYSKQKPGIRLMFWSGADFGEEGLAVVGKKFKDASIFYSDVNEIQKPDVQRWLQKAREIQWDYKNLIRRKGTLEHLR